MTRFSMTRFSLLLFAVIAAPGLFAPGLFAPAYAAPKAAKQSAEKHESHDSKAPIEISSDTLEVLQHENKAIFKGHVIAVQGDMRLSSDMMTVYYSSKHMADAKPAPLKTPAPAAAAPGAMGAITRIVVEGHVLVATPQEAAEGDKGNYDVNAHVLHLFGPNVTLTRDKNILRGTSLEYNLLTGRSLLSNESGVKSGAHPGRVRGVFVPNQDEKGGASKK